MDILTGEFSARGIKIFPSGRVSWPERYEAYADRYETTSRNVRKWVADGKKKWIESDSGDRILQLPPLFDPPAMVSWWKAHKKQRVPEGILHAAQEIQRNEPPKPLSALVTPKISEDDERKSAPPENDETVDGGADESLRQAREFVAKAYKNRLDAIDENDPAKAAVWGLEWTKAVETQRKWEKDITVINERRGNLLSRQKVEEELLTVASALQRGFLASMIKLLRENCPHLEVKEQRRLAIKERDSCFEVLREGDFCAHLFVEVE